MRVNAAPERGRANEEVLALLATALRLTRRQLRLVSGSSSSDKVIELAGLDAGEADRRLQQAGGVA